MINTTLCYIEKDGKYLMLHRVKKDKDINKGKWIGVGGKFEEGETADECVVREVFEETGLTLTDFKLVGVIHFYSDQNMDQDMYLYKGTDFEGELVDECKEGILEWVYKEEVLNLPTWEGDHYFLKPLLDGKTNLNMTVKYENDKLVEFIDDTMPVVIEKSKLISSKHGFSTRMGGVSTGKFSTMNLSLQSEDMPQRVVENYRRFFEALNIEERAFVSLDQKYGRRVLVVGKRDARIPFKKGKILGADGMVTNQVNVPLVIFTDDSIPVLLEDSNASVIGAAHCNRKSVMADIEANIIEKMVSLGAEISNIKVAIGPAIGECCYENGKEIGKQADTLLTSDASYFYANSHEDKIMLDLKGIVRERFLQLGILSTNIDMNEDCTKCNPEKYFSDRHNHGITGKMASVIVLEK